DPDTMYVAYGYKGYPGYGYVFPKRRHVDAGVGFLLSFFKERLDGPPYEHHARFLADARARGGVAGNSNPKNFKAYRLPLGGLLARVALGEEDLRRRKLELVLRFLLARFRRAPSAARRLVDSV